MTYEEDQTTRHLTPIELSLRWSMHPTSLCNWRVQGKGPKYIKIGKKVLYPIAEVEAFEAANLKKSTVS